MRDMTPTNHIRTRSWLPVSILLQCCSSLAFRHVICDNFKTNSLPSSPATSLIVGFLAEASRQDKETRSEFLTMSKLCQLNWQYRFDITVAGYMAVRLSPSHTLA